MASFAANRAVTFTVAALSRLVADVVPLADFGSKPVTAHPAMKVSAVDFRVCRENNCAHWLFVFPVKDDMRLRRLAFPSNDLLHRHERTLIQELALPRGHNVFFEAPGH